MLHIPHADAAEQLDQTKLSYIPDRTPVSYQTKMPIFHNAEKGGFPGYSFFLPGEGAFSAFITASKVLSWLLASESCNYGTHTDQRLSLRKLFRQLNRIHL